MSRFLSHFPALFGGFREPTALINATRDLASSMALGAGASDDKLQLAAEKFQEIQSGSRPGESLSPREIRRLAWALNMGDPPIAGSDDLPAALMLIAPVCRPKHLAGLITTLLQAKKVHQQGLVIWFTLVRQQLSTYDGPNPDLLHWKSYAHLVFATDAASKVGNWVLSQPTSIRQAFQTLRLPLGTAISRISLIGVVQAIAHADDFPNRVSDIIELVDTPNNPFLVKKTVDLLLQRYASMPHLGDNEDLVALAMTHLGDPRLVRNVSWLDLSTIARDTMEAWISRQDLELFFKAVTMDSRRRDFWLQYVKQMRQTKIVLGDHAVQTSDPIIHRYLKQNRFAKLDDSNRNINAFIFSIGRYKFVEFSQNGDACYAYPEDNSPIVYDKPSYAKDDLKDRRRRQMGIAWRILHQGPSWEYRAAYNLQERGIFPDRQ